MAKTIKAISEGFEAYLQMQTNVVGVKHLQTKEAFSNHTFKTSKYPMYYCYIVKLASKGRTLKASAKEIACETASKVIGLEPYYEDQSGVEGWNDIKVFHSTELSTLKHEQLKPSTQSKQGIAVGLLNEFDDVPDSLIFVLNAYQMMRLMQGYHYHYNENLAIKMSGQCGVCYESTMYPYEHKRMNVSALCSGTRFICKWTDDTLMVSMPYDMAEKVLDGVIQTTNPCEIDSNKIEIKNQIPENQITLNSNYYKK